MNCKKAQSLMLDHLYGELKPRRQSALMRHLNVCAKCSEEFEAHKSTASAFSHLRMEEPPEGIARRIAALAAEETRQAPLSAANAWHWKPILTGMATAALVIICVVYYLPVAKTNRERAATVGTPSMEQPQEITVLRKPQENAVFEGAGYREERDLKDSSTLTESTPAPATIEGGKLMLGDENENLAATPPSVDNMSPSDVRTEQKAKSYMARQLKSIDRGDSGRSAAPAVGSATDDIAYSPAKSVPAEQPLPEAEESKKEETAFLGSDKPDNAPASRIGEIRGQLAEDRDYLGNRNIEATEPPKPFAYTSGEGHSVEDAYKLGQKYQDAGLYKEAIGVYENIVKDHPDFPDIANIYLALGDCYLSMGKIDDAVRNFEIVREKFPAKREAALEKIDAALSAREVSETPTTPSPTDE